MIPSQNKRYWPHAQWGAEWLYYKSHQLWKQGHRRPAAILKYVAVLLFRTYIDTPAVIGARLDLPHGGFGVVIGPDVTIGDDAILFHGVTIGHARPGPIEIGHRFYAGAGATILGPIKIGNDVTIGANTTVFTDLPDGATVVGPQPRVILQKSDPIQNSSAATRTE